MFPFSFTYVSTADGVSEGLVKRKVDVLQNVNENSYFWVLSGW